ncbi:outer membrane beta-barrel protein [Enterovirga sp.]|uniref:outer membrane protein n=1 Tax=Enterovirga sp. TaxID=2026350 RepID=UPI002C19656E|nr:outer membrane beta-barrel protein [Enterovirga sp.]HMO29312.1 outer membrane beta-barrel protein [Enterovirga sp.]
MPRNLSFSLSCIAAAVALAGGRLPVAAAESPAPPGDVRCYLATGPTGAPRKFCESERIVTVGPIADGNPITTPTPATLALHEADRSSRAFGWTSPAGTGSRWSGLSLGAGLGAALGGGESRPVADAALRFDWNPDPASPWILGAEIGHQAGFGRAAGGPNDLSRAGATRFTLSAGLALSDRFRLAVDAGPAIGQGGPFRRQPAGWTAGIGLAYALDASWALTVDYRFTRIASRPAGSSAGQRVDHDRSVILGGVAYRFFGL